MISANGGLPAHRYTPQVTPRWPRGSEPASLLYGFDAAAWRPSKNELLRPKYCCECPSLRACVRACLYQLVIEFTPVKNGDGPEAPQDSEVCLFGLPVAN